MRTLSFAVEPGLPMESLDSLPLEKSVAPERTQSRVGRLRVAGLATVQDGHFPYQKSCDFRYSSISEPQAASSPETPSPRLLNFKRALEHSTEQQNQGWFHTGTFKAIMCGSAKHFKRESIVTELRRNCILTIAFLLIGWVSTSSFAQEEYEVHPDSLKKIQALEAQKNLKRDLGEDASIEQPPVFMKQLQNVGVVPEGQNVMVDAIIEPKNDPTLKVEWELNGTPIKTGNGK